MYVPENMSPQEIREVNPSLKNIDAWISSVGASIAINDIDNDGISNDICHVDPRFNSVIIQPASKQDNRYAPFNLDFKHDHTVAPMGCLPGDVNEDGFMDIVVYYWGRTPVAFIQVNNMDVKLSQSKFKTEELVDTDERWYTNAATFADLNGDGHQDLIIGNYFPDGARVLDKNADHQENMQDSMSYALNGGENKFLIWHKPTKEKSVQFKNETNLPPEILNGWTLAVGAVDLNGDQLPEVYFANDFGPDRLLLNQSNPEHLSFELLVGKSNITTPKSSVLGKDSFKGMGIDFGDVNNDGIFDLYVSNIADEFALLESHFLFVSQGEKSDFQNGIAPYQNKSEELGVSRSSWGWDSKLVDFNNDGVLEAIQATGFIKGKENKWIELQEIAMGNDVNLKDPKSWPDITKGDDLSGWVHNPFYVMGANGTYVDIAEELGINEPQVTRGIATGDLEGDGDIDFAYANQWEDSYVYQNNCNKCGKSIVLNLKIPVNQVLEHSLIVKDINQSNILGLVPIGATVKATLTNGRKIVNYVDGGNGHSGKRSYEVHFGLGDESEKVKIDIQWRDRDGIHHETFYLEAGRYTIFLKNQGGSDG